MTRAKGGSDEYPVDEHPVDEPKETPEETSGSTPVDTSVDTSIDGHGIVADLRRVTGALAAAESRPGQERMASAVATAITRKRHLIVQAGTGTGKSAAYLVPAIQAATHGATGSSEGGQGKPVIIVTASKALQDQLAVKDLPFIAEHLGTPFDYAVLKGRSNYLCMQRVNEHIAAARGSSKNQAQGQLDLEELAPAVKLEVKKLTQWSARTESGDQSELDWAPSDKAWSEVSVGSEECPGANRCPAGQECFAENARAKATMADVVVVNTFLYGLDVASDGAILPDHDVVIFDEAHQLEDVMSDTVGVSIGPGRFTKVAQALRRVLEDPQVVGGVADASLILREALSDEAGNRLSNPLPSGISKALVAGRNRLEKAANALRGIETTVDDAKQRLLRAQTLIIRLTENIDAALSYGTQYVAFVSGGPEMPRLEIAPLDVGPVMSKSVWSKRTAVLTSATVPSSLAERVGLPAATTDQLDVGSPFDYEHNGMLYCAVELPDPRQPAYAAAMHAELIALIEAAGGRTLALFTSWKAMDEAAEAVKRGLAGKGGEPKFPVLTQRDLPKPALIKAFSEDPSSCLFATAGFFQGVDIPGDTLTLVTIDKIPFPRPDDPLLSARREKLGPAAFGAIDIPRAAMLLAQAAGRLIRTATDRGVVAVFDNRLGKANYRWDLVRALPPMKRTRHRSEAEDFLRELAG